MRTPNNAQYVDAFNAYLKKQAPAGYSTTDNPVGIERILQEFADTEKYQVNFHWDEYKFLMFERCTLGPERIMTLDMNGSYLLRPVLLETCYFPKQEDCSFMRLAYQGLKPSGVYSKEDYPRHRDEIGFEEYARAGGRNYDHSILEQGFLEHDEYGDEIPLPNDATSVVRFLRDGHFLIVSKGSVFNANHMNKSRYDLQERGREAVAYEEIGGMN